ncbi:hypothetical protein UGMREWDR_CDS0052 [Aeromonas phage GomatiRiver_11]|nr:hypothetical protein OBDJBBDK_00047 [Aeromonas phage AhFM11]WKW84219.1 hypothetical protein UGMREWDR_CDS0052 [Aeromonas phage GomatiRiver_11]
MLNECERQKVRMRFESPEKFQKWKDSWHSDTWNKYEWNPEFDALASCEYHIATIDDNVSGRIGIWEIYSNKTNKVIKTERVALMPDEVDGVDYEIIGIQPHQDPVVVSRIEELLDMNARIREELEQIVGQGLLSYEQFERIQKILDK